MHTPNANIFSSSLGGFGKDSGKYFDRNWKSHFKLNSDISSKNPLQQLLFLVNVVLTGSYLDLWNLVILPRMYVTRDNCSVCKRKQRKKTVKHLVAHCPICQNLCHTNGSVKSRSKFTCSNESHDETHNFTINTCYERIYFRWQCSIFALKLLGQGNSLKGIRKLTGITRHFLDLVISTTSKHTREKGILREKIKGDFLAVYLDGTYVLRGCTLIAKVGDQIFWRCTTAEDSETIRDLLLELKEIVSVNNLIFVTDGLKNYVKPIQELFPDAIHVRHFHNTWDDIVIHFGHKEKKYTLYAKSNIFLPSGEKQVIFWEGTKFSLNRTSKKISKEQKNPLKELMVTLDQIYFLSNWDGKKMQRFSIWLGRVSDAIIADELPRETEQMVKKAVIPENMPLKFRTLVRLRIKEFEFNIKNRRKKYRYRQESNKVERLAKGDVSDVVNKYPFLQRILDIVKKEFDGKHITSNPVEGVHSIFQPYLHMHRTLKGNSRLMELILYLLYSGRSIEEILPFKTFLSMEICREQNGRIRSDRTYFIKYIDRHRNTTERIIKVIDVEKGYVWAFCYLRNDVRKFKKNRISFFEERNLNMLPFDDEISCRISVIV